MRANPCLLAWFAAAAIFAGMPSPLNADPEAKRSDPNNPADQGEAGDPETGGNEQKAPGHPTRDRS